MPEVMPGPLYPGSTLGVLGGGQLGRMFAIEALRMGYLVWVMDPDPKSPAGQIASHHIQAAFDDHAALDKMAKGCDAITTEFENIPASSMRFLALQTRVAPSADCIEIAQDRRAEKNFAREHGLRTADFAVIESEDDIDAAGKTVGFPSILKTAQLGYDGKGQFVCQNPADIRHGFSTAGGVACVLEQKVDLRIELSVVLSRNDEGDIACFPVAENQHTNGILDISLAPARIDAALADSAISMSSKLAHALSYVGVMAVELFVDQAGNVLINEMAPRPHNSGHFTLDATVTSQFEQQVRMLCGLSAGSVALLSPVAMLNLLGDSWNPEQPDWHSVYAGSANKLHLYGKAEARAGRKMGHINVLGNSVDAALDTLRTLRQQL